MKSVKNENSEKQRKCISVSCPKDYLTQKLGSYVKKVRYVAC